MKKIFDRSKFYLRSVSINLWKVVKYYSYFYVSTNYLIPVGLVVAKGNSMEPTIKNYNILLTEKVSVRRQHLQK